ELSACVNDGAAKLLRRHARCPRWHALSMKTGAPGSSAACAVATRTAAHPAQTVGAAVVDPCDGTMFTGRVLALHGAPARPAATVPSRQTAAAGS
ncbi:MAG: hypothetical protein AAF566_07315, partial [Pseudomonadota bacterium]